jgi:hypothetical protein
MLASFNCRRKRFVGQVLTRADLFNVVKEPASYVLHPSPILPMLAHVKVNEVNEEPKHFETGFELLLGYPLLRSNEPTFHPVSV